MFPEGWWFEKAIIPLFIGGNEKMTAQQKFIDQIGKAAQAYYPKYQILPSLVIAMAIKESAWGVSALGAKNHN